MHFVLKEIWLMKNQILLQLTYPQLLISYVDMFGLFKELSQKMLSKCHASLSGFVELNI